ncbi:MAG: MgtC/SapB family protein [Gemmobacter sp.]|jgi:putative Mg2+ transporter-C (MgtC) family protein|nr:MgtC/SapB family protein [Gemmobacter sp.]
MPIALEFAAINLATAMACGALIGSERQIRQRMAGLRTNALVALGAASYVVFSQLFPDEVSPTRVAAQVVSGIGFLGAGIIFRDGFNVHGLNTAATLWCSAAVGLLAGAGAWPFALMLTAFVVLVNLGLRPLVRWIKKKTRAGVPLTRAWRLSVTCRPSQEGDVRALMLRNLALGGLHLSEVSAVTAAEGLIEIAATITGEGLLDKDLEQAAARMAVEPGLASVRWQVLDET